MDRLQKKCFIASTGVHLLLVLILLVGPGFLSAPNKMEDPIVSDFIPSRLIDGLTGGGNRDAGQMAPPPAPPQNNSQTEPPRPEPPQPDPPKKAVPEPERDPVKPQPKDPKSDPDVLPEPKKQPLKKPEVNLKQVVRHADQKAPTKPNANDAAEKEAKRLADLRQGFASKFRGAAGTLGNRLTPGISIELGEYGPGSGGPAAMNYDTYVKETYEAAWLAPDDAEHDDAITKVTVKISRDGSVVLARIIRASGDALVDASVRRTLDRVKKIAPFPEGSRDQERTYTINFNLRAKRATG